MAVTASNGFSRRLDRFHAHGAEFKSSVPCAACWTTMKIFFISSSIAVILLIAFLSIEGRPNHLRIERTAMNSRAVITTDFPGNLPTTTTSPNQDVSRLKPVAAAAPHELTKTDIQKQAEVIRSALQSGDLANWDHISQNELPQLIQSDPKTAADVAQSLEPGFIREQMLRQVAHGWADQNSTTALAWADGLSDPADRNSVLTDICIQMSQANPAGAIVAITQYGLSNQGGLLESMMQQWAAKDAGAALEWADRLPADADRISVMSSLAFVESQTSPTEAIKLVAYEIAPGAAQEEAVISILHQWALQDFTTASAWVDQFDEGALQNRAKQELAGIYEYRQKLNN